MSTATALVTLETPELAALPPSKAEQIRSTFGAMADMLQTFDADYDAIVAARANVTPELSARARRLRLDIAKVRLNAEKARVTIKAEYLLASKAIDGVSNILKWAVSQKEEALEDIEKHAERLEAERIRTLQAERVELLAPYVADAADRALGSLDADVWEAYLAGRKQAHTDRIEAERRAQEERAERERLHAAEAEAIRVERDRLAKEAEKQARARRAELAKIEKEREAERVLIAAERQKERAEAEAERARLAAEREQERAAAETERRRLAALETHERERLAREREEAQERAEAEAEAAAAPLRERLVSWVDSFELPDLPGEGHEAADAIREKFAAFQGWARGQVARVRPVRRDALLREAGR